MAGGIAALVAQSVLCLSNAWVRPRSPLENTLAAAVRAGDIMAKRP
jgi:hypothetical protein